MLIKGNNLLALHALEPRLAGKVKLIYIDPPYNTGSDGFKYNDDFNHSSWLVFMKNRLEIAQKLLKDDGVILVHCDDQEQAYLKVLMDEVFGRDNFVETFIWKNSDNAPNLSKKSRSSVEYIHAYEKKMDKSIPYIGKLTENGDAPLNHRGNSIKELTFPQKSIKFNIKDCNVKVGKPDRIEIMNEFEIFDGLNDRAVRLKGDFVWTQEKLEEEIQSGTYFIVKSDKFAIRFQRLNTKPMAPEKFIGNNYLTKSLGIGTNEDASSHLREMNIKFAYSKPESIVAFFIKAITNPGDIVLDYHLGSGTTAAVAHKMGRRWIGIEQMDYIENITKERLKKVIAGEQGGVSEALKWHGGGTFVYFELKKYNQEFLERIMAADSLSALKAVQDDMFRNAFLTFWTDAREFREEHDYGKLSLEERKKKLIAVLDENHFYLNKREMNDKRHVVSGEEKALTTRFYGEG
ncbi:site-specific DNA-methyltransferase [Formicincola oecophyllae]|uniref:Methyltransferase n=1 Tax=Formicincola oecophyllae TaxID=2558361 RepID=A0A4Y6UC99_9PROT|nr:site-specific DNA-methyltransferase [Formicincola oecophyllae]